jgi:hypothetical protein
LAEKGLMPLDQLLPLLSNYQLCQEPSVWLLILPKLQTWLMLAENLPQGPQLKDYCKELVRHVAPNLLWQSTEETMSE